MTRDEGLSAWLASRTVTPERRDRISRWLEHPRFRAADGTVVRSIVLDGRRIFEARKHGMLVCYAADLAELDRYVDVGTLVLDIGQGVK